jgi:sulfur carrier protein ThiS
MQLLTLIFNFLTFSLGLKEMIEVVIYPGGRKKRLSIEKRRVRVGSLVRKLGYLQYSVVVVKNGLPLTEDAVVEDGDRLELYEVVSTG